MSSDPIPPPDSDPDPVPPVSGPVAPFTSNLAQTTSTGIAPNVAAGLSALFTILGGILFILLEKKNQFVRFWAMQSIFFGAAWFLFSILSNVIGGMMRVMFLGWLWAPIHWIIYLGFVVVWIITIIQAFSGKAWEIPVLGKLARQQLAKTPLL